MTDAIAPEGHPVTHDLDLAIKRLAEEADFPGMADGAYVYGPDLRALLAAWNRRPTPASEGEAVAWRWQDCGIEFAVRGDQPHPHYAQPLYARPVPSVGREELADLIDRNEAYAANVMDENRLWLARILADAILAALGSRSNEATGGFGSSAEGADTHRAAETAVVGDWTAKLEKALELALGYLARFEPGDSRAVSDEYVAMLAVLCRVEPNELGGEMAIIEAALARLEQATPASDTTARYEPKANEPNTTAGETGA